MTLITRDILTLATDSLACIFTCAVQRRHSSASTNPARQLSLQPVVVGADDGGNIHHHSRGTYGAPRIHAELATDGIRIGRKHVARLKREMALAGISRRKGTRTTRRDHRLRPAPDLVERRFEADAPDVPGPRVVMEQKTALSPAALTGAVFRGAGSVGVIGLGARKGADSHRGQAGHPDQGVDDALCPIRRSRARPDLGTHPRGPGQGQIIRQEARTAQGIAGCLPPRRQGG